MTVKKLEIKVDVNCEKCKNAIMEAVTELEGVHLITLDEDKNVLTVVGTMDPVCVVKRLKKIKQKPVIISIGPPKPPEPNPPPGPPPGPAPGPALGPPPGPAPVPPPTPAHNCKPMPPHCNCDFVSINTYESGSGCTIV